MKPPDPAGRPDVAIYLENLEGGGVQAICLNIARELLARGRRPTLVVSESDGALRADVPAAIGITEVRASSRLATLRRIMRLGGMPPALPAAILWHRDDDASLRHVPALADYLAATRPHTLLAATPFRNLEALLACRLVAQPPRLLVTEHNDLGAGHPLGQGSVGLSLAALQRRLYPGADAIVAVSRGVAADIVRRSGIAPNRVEVVYNPVVIPRLPALAAEPVAHPWLAEPGPPVVLGVGRLSAAKDFHMLVRAFVRLRRRVPARLVIIGQDKSAAKTARRHQELRAIAAAGGVADDVDFPGFVRNPFSWMARAAVLGVSSRHEGFCNVIAEALACGCPVVSTDCPSGPAEILEDGKWGRLVPVGDEATMAEALEATLNAPSDPVRLRERAEPFTVAAAVDRYEALLFGGRAGLTPES
ncbi:MAG TPA: glycosyltransferase [Geminicoccaceae bacterium]|nr:glycosyltransferase [Geminicoccus sp.]HMU49148.1 glycosyltransferase [Geminicoccaceae bacterium]